MVNRRYLAVVMAADVVAGLGAAFLAGLLVGPVVGRGLMLSWPAVVGAIALLPLWAGALASTRSYEELAIGSGSEEYRRVLDAGVRFCLALVVGLYVTSTELSRGFVGLLVPSLLVLTAVGRNVSRRWLLGQRLQGRYLRRVLVVGNRATAANLVTHLRRAEDAGYHVAGACVGGPSLEDADGEPVAVLGAPDDVLDVVVTEGIDVVAIADPTTLQPGALRALSWELEGTGVDLVVAPAVTDVAGPRIVARPLNGLPLLWVGEPEFRGLRRVLKDTVDRMIALVALVAALPVLVAIGLAVRLTSPGPALFRQIRVGRDGRRFTIYKFRTMVADADDRVHELAAHNELDGPLFKMRNDPRITRIGAVLRRYSIDELPQLINVVRGEMSLVGPRPPLPSEVEQYEEGVERRLLVKPGLTGLWQVSGRADLPWSEAVRLDLYYVENWSPMLDMVILGKTVTAVVRRQGAY